MIGAESHGHGHTDTGPCVFPPRLDELLSPGYFKDISHAVFFTFHLQALNGRLLQTLPFSFGSLRFASSFKVMMEALTCSFCPGEACSIISLQPALQSGLPVHAWLSVTERTVCIDHDRKKEATFVSPFPTCCQEFNIFFPPLSLPKCVLILII